MSRYYCEQCETGHEEGQDSCPWNTANVFVTSCGHILLKDYRKLQDRLAVYEKKEPT